MTPLHYLIAMLATVAVIYGCTAGAYYFTARPGMALVFVGYLVAQFGLIIDALR